MDNAPVSKYDGKTASLILKGFLNLQEAFLFSFLYNSGVGFSVRTAYYKNELDE